MSYFELAALSESLSSTAGLEHAVLQSLRNWKKAQDNDPLDDGVDKQGWWANDLISSAVGCRDWTLARSKQTDDTLHRAKRYTARALQWLIDDKIADSITVTASFDGGQLTRVITITLPDNTTTEVTI